MKAVWALTGIFRADLLLLRAVTFSLDVVPVMVRTVPVPALNRNLSFLMPHREHGFETGFKQLQ